MDAQESTVKGGVESVSVAHFNFEQKNTKKTNRIKLKRTTANQQKRERMRERKKREEE